MQSHHYRTHPQNRLFYCLSLTSSGLKLIQLVASKRLRSSMHRPDNPVQFAYESNRTTLDDVAFFRKSAYASTRSACCTFFDYSSAFGSKPQPLQLHKLLTCGCPMPTLKWLSGCLINQIKCKTSKLLVDDTSVVHGDLLSLSIFSAYISTSSSFYLFYYANNVALSSDVSSSDDNNYLSL